MKSKHRLLLAYLSLLLAVLLTAAAWVTCRAGGEGDWGVDEITRSYWSFPGDDGPTNTTGMFQYKYGTKGGLLEIEIQGESAGTGATYYTLEPYIELSTYDEGGAYFTVGPYIAICKTESCQGEDYWTHFGACNHGTANANHRIWISVTIVSSKTWTYEFVDCDTSTVITKGRVDLPAGFEMEKAPQSICKSNEYYEVSYDAYARQELHKGDGLDWSVYGDPSLSGDFVYHDAETSYIPSKVIGGGGDTCENPLVEGGNTAVCSTRLMGARTTVPPPPFTPGERAEIKRNFLRRDRLPDPLPRWVKWFHNSWLRGLLIHLGVIPREAAPSASGWPRMDSWYVPNEPPTPTPRGTPEP